MWTYIIRRLLLMVPTLFGVTVVSFLVMQLAPGDPVVTQLSSGSASQSGLTSEAVKAMRHELKLDKPLVLNFRYYADYTERLRQAAHFLALDESMLVAELPSLQRHDEDPQVEARWRFARSLGIPDFDKELADPESYKALAHALSAYTTSFCDDLGENGVPVAIALLRSPDTSLELKNGVVRELQDMLMDPFVYTYSSHPSDAETLEIQAAWKLWWDRNKQSFPPLDAETRQTYSEGLKKLVEAKTPSDLLDQLDFYDRDSAPFFAETLLGESVLQEKVVSALILRRVAGPLRTDVPAAASTAEVAEAMENWLRYYDFHSERFEPTAAAKLWYVVADTQYAHMLWRLVTFNFGRSALTTREPVSEKIWRAFVVSAPLMFWSQLFLYLVAIPLGILCAVYRSGWTDRLVSFGLFLLYSMPPFVAAMLMLKYLCYGGKYPEWFPMSGLHADAAESFGFWHYLLDYVWHAFLPIVCLSLFGLASMAMYARSSLLDVINQDYIRTARAKGLSRRSVIFKHALRNSLIPIVTLFSSILPAMLGGSVLIEVLFSIPGLGKMSWDTIKDKDFPTIMALTYIEAIVVLVSILLTDLMYVLIDPRISFEGRGKAT